MNASNQPLRDLYPFLHGDRQDAADLDVALLESVRQKAAHSIEIKQRFFAPGSRLVTFD